MGERFLQLDVFASRAGGGNPLGVVIGAEHWPDATMQAFAAWTDLVETTFLLPPTLAGASYRLRIFTPTREIAFAGHPTVGSACAALATGLVEASDGQLVQQCEAGMLPIRLRRDGGIERLYVQAPAATVLVKGEQALALLAGTLDGLDLGGLPPALVEGGRRWWLAEVKDEAALRGWRPDHAAIAALAGDTGSLGLCVFARSVDPAHQLVVRAFPAGVGIAEDPASGAANGLIAAYIAECEPGGRLARGYRVSQGREIGRDAVIDIEFEGNKVWVGGQAHIVIDGALHWPAARR